MSLRETLIRHRHIINKLRKKPSSFKEIADYLEGESDMGNDFTVSKRTFDRDREDIFSIYGIEIKYDFTKKVYSIEDDNDPLKRDKLLDAFDTLYLLNIGEDLSKYIHLEPIRPKGTDNLFGLLHAIKNKLRINFDYEKFSDNTLLDKLVEPYSLKEFKNRWYLIGKDVNDNYIKTFALDRIKGGLEITKINFNIPASLNINEMFKYSFGIYTNQDREPEEVILSFKPDKGVYIKSLPLHQSQKILVDDDKEFRIKLKIHTTYDFVMEILSHGSNVKILQPASLAELLKADYERAWKQYV